jgi:hypothetical protein
VRKRETERQTTRRSGEKERISSESESESERGLAEERVYKAYFLLHSRAYFFLHSRAYFLLHSRAYLISPRRVYTKRRGYTGSLVVR